jgi:hypothetical protein
MIRSLKTGLDYYQANFGPYQFRQARIIEFPAYANFAQAFANTMPYSRASASSRGTGTRRRSTTSPSSPPTSSATSGGPTS